MKRWSNFIAALIFFFLQARVNESGFFRLLLYDNKYFGDWACHICVDVSRPCNTKLTGL